MMTLTHMRCPYCHGKNVEVQRTYTIQCGEPRTLYHLSLSRFLSAMMRLSPHNTVTGGTTHGRCTVH